MSKMAYTSISDGAHANVRQGLEIVFVDIAKSITQIETHAGTNI